MTDATDHLYDLTTDRLRWMHEDDVDHLDVEQIAVRLPANLTEEERYELRVSLTVIAQAGALGLVQDLPRMLETGTTREVVEEAARRLRTLGGERS